MSEKNREADHDRLITCDCISGSELLRAFNDANPDNLTLEQHIDIAISMAMEEAAAKQIIACSNAVSNCELVEKGVQRIRLLEAVGACICADIYAK